MDRLLICASLSLTLAASVARAESDTAQGQHLVAGIDASYVSAAGLPSWTEGFVGKLRYDDGNDGLLISRAFVDYEARLTDTVDAHAALEFYDDGLGSIVDATEAYLEWRPVPRSPNRYRLKVGAFYPRISLENTEPGWGSPYTLNSSAVNTWVAEELRTVGAELSISRRPRALGGEHQLGLQIAMFWANDPAGSLLAWKGWSVHDRQSRISDMLPLPPLPQIQEGMIFEYQDPFVRPFREVDNRTGYYVNGEWRKGNQFLFRAMHYDNRADPVKFVTGQYAWTTRFDHVGAQVSLPAGFGLIAQWMYGTTAMGPVVNGAHLVDVEYDGAFLLLTKALDRHRLSLRYDNFSVTQEDQTPEDNNPEDGLAWTVSYRYAMSDTVSLAAEWLSIKTHHCGWVYYGIDPTATERQLQLSVMLRFSK